MGIIEWAGVAILFLIGCELADKTSDKNGKQTMQAVQKKT